MRNDAAGNGALNLVASDALEALIAAVSGHLFVEFEHLALRVQVVVYMQLLFGCFLGDGLLGAHLLALLNHDLDVRLVGQVARRSLLRFPVQRVDRLFRALRIFLFLAVDQLGLVLFHLEIGQMHNHFDFFQKGLVGLLVARFELARVGLLCRVQRVLHFRDRVEFPFSIDLSLDIVDFVFGWLKVVLDFLQSLLNGFLVLLRVIPLNHGLVQIELHLANCALVLIDHDLVHRPLHDFGLSAERAAAQRSEVLLGHLLQLGHVELLGRLQRRSLVRESRSVKLLVVPQIVPG